jgi:gas vesicle protein
MKFYANSTREHILIGVLIGVVLTAVAAWIAVAAGVNY